MMKNKGLVKKLSTAALSLFVVGFFATSGASRPAYAMIEEDTSTHIALKFGIEKIEQLKKINKSSPLYAILQSSEDVKKTEESIEVISDFIKLVRNPKIKNIPEKEAKLIEEFCSHYHPPSPYGSFPNEELLYYPLNLLYIETQNTLAFYRKNDPYGGEFVAMPILKDLSNKFFDLSNEKSYFSSKTKTQKFYDIWQDYIQILKQMTDKKAGKLIIEHEEGAKNWMKKMENKLSN
jgi:hypothetical protein